MKIKLLVLAMFLFPVILSAQDIPSGVKQKATELYPNATNVKWDIEGKDQYEASLTNNGVSMSLLFDKDANLLATETKMDISQLPQNVRDYVGANYKGMEITEAAKIIDNKGVMTYEAEVYDGRKHKDVLFDSSGNPLKKKEKDDDDDEEEDDGD